ncbi:MAG: pantetheine-phosphate adenylyltransferase [Muribaculaceae bacterium]|jgi:pantetheine-phosphate adenylyltransferase|nr:pantetheine-phosphate adenylyltransferase [Muribaculaceae bacterium]HUN19747.1 pantetheine-phosphate adenylyltransferase [Muribaculaceae bacterium]
MTHRFHDDAPVGRVALFPGTFNPFTLGHASVVERSLPLFDRIVIAVGVNIEKGMPPSIPAVEAIRRVYADEPRVDVVAYGGLTVDVAREAGARFLLRGVRSVKDFEYERTLADANRGIGGLETVLVFSLPEYSWLSSTVVRDLMAHGRDVAQYLPEGYSLDC